MHLNGGFLLRQGDGEWKRVPNALMQNGMVALLGMIFQAATGVINSGGNWWLGLRDGNYSVTDTLASITGEPSLTTGYARKALVRSAAGWPTIELINGNGHVRSLSAGFTAAGSASYTASRMFLTSASAGTVGTLFSVSALFPQAITVNTGAPLVAKYDLWMD